MQEAIIATTESGCQVVERVTGAWTLDRVPPGTMAKVVSVDRDSVVGRRLRRLGFWPGAPVRVVRRAPLGDPVEYYVHGFRVALRRSEARCVRVQPQ